MWTICEEKELIWILYFKWEREKSNNKTKFGKNERFSWKPFRFVSLSSNLDSIGTLFWINILNIFNYCTIFHLKHIKWQSIDRRINFSQEKLSITYNGFSRYMCISSNTHTYKQTEQNNDTYGYSGFLAFHSASVY